MYTHLHPLSLPDALPISPSPPVIMRTVPTPPKVYVPTPIAVPPAPPAPPAPRVDQSAKIRGNAGRFFGPDNYPRSEEHTSELQSLMRNSYADFCLQKKKKTYTETIKSTRHDNYTI